MIAKLNLASFFAALVLFFVPWLDFQCSGKTMATQSGIQAVYGGVSLDPNFEKMGSKTKEQSTNKNESKDRPGISVLVGLAFVVVLIGFALSLMIFRGSSSNTKIAPVLSGLALVLVASQMMIGFPIEKSISESQTDASSQGAGALGPSETELLFAQLNFGVVYRPWIYFEMAFLALPLAVAFFGMQPRKAVIEEEAEILLP